MSKVTKERRIQVLKNKIDFCEKKNKHKKIKKELKRELDRLVNS